MTTFQKGSGDWKKYLKLEGRVREYDCHFGEEHGYAFYELMDKVYNDVLDVLKQEHENGGDWVLITHGWSSSGRGKITARSQVRKLMRGKDATPYIDRKRCIQHDSVFVAAIRKKKQT